MKYIKHLGNSIEGYSIGIQAKGLLFWIDLDIVDNDVRTEWNQYIFFDYNEEDQIRKKYQENTDFFTEITSYAIKKCLSLNLIHQDDKGNWSYINENNIYE